MWNPRLHKQIWWDLTKRSTDKVILNFVYEHSKSNVNEAPVMLVKRYVPWSQGVDVSFEATEGSGVDHLLSSSKVMTESKSSTVKFLTTASKGMIIC